MTPTLEQLESYY